MTVAAFAQAGKREITKAQNRQAILDAAREVFGESGFEAVTVPISWPPPASAWPGRSAGRCLRAGPSTSTPRRTSRSP